MSAMPRNQPPEKKSAKADAKSGSAQGALASRTLAAKTLAFQAIALAAAGTAAAWLVGIKLLGRPYYFAWAIVAVMGIYLLLAWLLYLRDDAFMAKPREPAAERSGNHGSTPSGASSAAKPLRRSVRVLLLAAALLAALSLVLYFRFGIGAAL
jgi:hypothetical protein